MGAGNDKGGSKKAEVVQHSTAPTWPDVQTLVQRLSRRPLTHFYTSFSPSSTPLGLNFRIYLSLRFCKSSTSMRI